MAVGDEIAAELGFQSLISVYPVTPISLIGAATDETDYVVLAKALDKAAKEIGVDFIGGFSALVQKGYQRGVRFSSIPFLALWLKRIRFARQSISAQPSLVLI